MKISLRTNLLTILALSLGLGACAPDRDLDNYARDKAESDRAKAEAIAGVYVGDLKLKKDDSTLGTMGLELGTTSVPDSFNSTKPVLTGQMVFQASNAIPVNFTSGTFNPTDNSFTLTYTLTSATMSAQPTVLSISGNVDGDTVKGKLEVVGENGYGGTFVLSKKPSVKDVQGYLTQEGTTGNPIESVNLTYTGTGVDRGTNMGSQATLTLSNTSGTVDMTSRFANLFQRKKIVFADLALLYSVTDDSGKVTTATDEFAFTDAVWDPTTGVLEAINNNAQLGSTQHLTCAPKNNVDVNGALGCTVQLSKINSFSIDVTVEPAKGLK